MSRRSTRQFDGSLTAVSDALYDAALGDATWQSALALFCRAIPSAAANLVVYAPDRRFGACAAVHNLSPESQEAYRRHYWRIDVWRIETERARPPLVHPIVSEAVLPERSLLRSEFYDAVLRREGIRHFCGGPLLRRGSEGVAFLLYRGARQGAFGRADIARMQALQPHVARAVQLHARIFELEARWAALMAAEDADARAVLVFDARERLVEANAAGMALLRCGDAMFVDETGLRLRDGAADRALRAHIGQLKERAPAPPSPAPILANGPARRIRLHLVPLPRAALFPAANAAAFIVVVEADEHRREGLLRDAAARYGLTPAESNLLRELAAGRSLSAAAERLARAGTTARNQLQSIFHKTGTHRQAELVVKVLNGAA